MKDTVLFQKALGLEAPWFVSRCEFNAEQKRLDLYLNFPKGAEFCCPECGQTACKAYDTEEKRVKSRMLCKLASPAPAEAASCRAIRSGSTLKIAPL